MAPWIESALLELFHSNCLTRHDVRATSYPSFPLYVTGIVYLSLLSGHSYSKIRRDMG